MMGVPDLSSASRHQQTQNGNPAAPAAARASMVPGHPDANMMMPHQHLRGTFHNHPGMNRYSFPDPPAHDANFGVPRAPPLPGSSFPQWSALPGRNPIWQSGRDMPNRREMIQRIVKLLKKGRDGGSPLPLQKLPLMAKQLEVSLYRSAGSCEDYMDVSTLKHRLGVIAMEASKASRAPSGCTNYTKVGSATFLSESSVVAGNEEVQTLQFDFPNFANLPHGSVIESPCLECHGYSWRILLRPGGHVSGEEEEEEEGVAARTADTYVAVELELASCLPGNTEDTSASVNTDVCLRTGARQVHQKHHFSIPGIFASRDFLKREQVLDPNSAILKGGALTIEVDIRVHGAVRKPVWTPKKKESDDLIKVLEDPEWAGISFVVDGKKFPACLGILSVRAPTLADMVKDSKADVEISGCVGSETFESILRFVYGHVLPEPECMTNNGRALLEASNRFGCHQLKMHVESQIVKSLVVNVDNAAEWLVFADSHSCPLLKEAAINTFRSNPTKVMESCGWATLEESAALLSELMRATFRKRPRGCDDENDPNNMDVSTLRSILEEKGLDVDGTKQMLIQRLNGAP